ncbi:hypothetical protein ABIF68_004213 [Bradyrhizobium japonicum]|uniref:hypothetical protein n=1 Tax=Bradyrhizobium TaxID=374 RepID=UPI0004BB7263|nr:MULTISPECIES: hypothetical protein [Bradyrhizobium]MDI2077801.1 hypothetical protein [Bradyrhizobium sp. Mp27]
MTDVNDASLHGFNPYTPRVDHDVIGDSVFKFRDTLTSHAEIGDLAALFKDEVIAIIGLGGTGCYILDFMVKTPVKEIRGLDGEFLRRLADTTHTAPFMATALDGQIAVCTVAKSGHV